MSGLIAALRPRAAPTGLAPRDWLLLFLNGGLDPIRIQKGMFLFAMETDSPSREVYAFEPYNWGPMSKSIYFDLEALLAEGLVERVPVRGQTYSHYRRTTAGDGAAAALAARADEARRGAVDAIREKVTTMSFDSLLREVYERYPKFATKSLFGSPTG